MTGARRLEALIDRLATVGWLKSPEIRKALHAVPRQMFVPPVALVSPLGEDYLIDEGRDPAAWLDAAYSDDPIVTQIEDGAVPLEGGKGDFTSSCSAPSTVVALLELLQAERGHRVLEIGTGTGWTAGLLCELVGEKYVTSVEIDPQVADRAARNLREAGRSPRLVVGDGVKGSPEGAPYDRVHVTCGVREVPYAWVEQTRPGGVAVLPYSPGFGYSHELRLVVMPDGTALGRFPGHASYMMLRSQRKPDLDFGDAEASRSVTRTDPRTIGYASPGADLAMSAALGDVFSQGHEEDGVYTLWLWSPSGSWATAIHRPDQQEYEIRQAGDRRLWEETETAYFRWVTRGEPGRDRFGMTVTPAGQRIWLDSPDNLI
ncbi:protein-L-isoaspartate(D-aspartate) O-methyltransferase [Actinomadura craniellae]|uniref:Protein-L-isoaspartate O-methyltransferase n=1 Tax=Actinomadura craniellae TaxID=2231787 RepID=A0A365H8J5_9ACTN|nr:methyltransferase domain-containing protein [Actinomadura craniellae]RAY15359.1 protein-L-isoaspartate(D-aspartate) O-methyltransferase [Actinomadura craniellae]